MGFVFLSLPTLLTCRPRLRVVLTGPRSNGTIIRATAGPFPLDCLIFRCTRGCMFRKEQNQKRRTRNIVHAHIAWHVFLAEFFVTRGISNFYSARRVIDATVKYLIFMTTFCKTAACFPNSDRRRNPANQRTLDFARAQRSLAQRRERNGCHSSSKQTRADSRANRRARSAVRVCTYARFPQLSVAREARMLIPY